MTNFTKRIVSCLLVFALTQSVEAEKGDLGAYVKGHADEAWAAALQIWEWAEPGYQERRSSEKLAALLERAGFKVRRGVAGIPTGFTATYGEGKPVIGILGEFDALPGLSQNAVPTRSPQPGKPYGHACGHHLFGVASAYAALAVADRIAAGEISGTVRFYGTPAEEGGSGKVFMVRAGLFGDCDAVLHWHPGESNSAGDSSTLARMAAKFRFHGVSAHAARAPEQGRSALDAVELMNHAAQLLREHTPEDTRIHHVITFGGGAPNVVPDFAEVYYYVRHPDAVVVRKLYERLVLCARGAATATETKLEINFQGGIHNVLPNRTLSMVTLRNIRELAKMKYTEDEEAFALEIQKTLAAPEPLESIAEVFDRSGSISMGSTDVGDVSWVVPTTGFVTACWAPGTPAHSWQAVAAGGTTLGRQGMLLAARVLAATAWDLYHDENTLAGAKLELDERLEAKSYESLLEPGQAPPLDYRNPPKR